MAKPWKADQDHEWREVGTSDGRPLWAYVTKDPEILETGFLWVEGDVEALLTTEFFCSGRDLQLIDTQDQRSTFPRVES